MGTVEERVRKQFEFYLSSSNLMRDKFLRPTVQADPEGYVDLEMMANFPRVQTITRDRDLLVRALRKSKELELNKDATRVRRRSPFVEYDTEANTVYAENLGDKYDHDVVRRMMERFGQVNYVSLPRNPDKSFKGFAFVEFERHEDALAAIEGLHVFHATDNPQGLRVMHRQQWLEMKKKFKRLVLQGTQPMTMPPSNDTDSSTAEGTKREKKRKEPEEKSEGKKKDEDGDHKDKRKKKRRKTEGDDKAKKKKKREGETSKKKKLAEEKGSDAKDQDKKKKKKKKKKES